jgi:SAM-dependent methyltransferase
VSAERTFLQTPALPRNLRAEAQVREYHAIANRIALDDVERVLDWGCGYGQVSELLREAGISVTPLEYRPDIDEPCVEEYAWYPGLEVCLTPDPVQLPFDDGSFDAVLSCGVLEHVTNPDGSLEEIRRVLTRDGRFYIYKLPNRLSYVEWLRRRAGLYHHGSKPNDRLYDKRSAHRLLERHGFRVVEFRRTNMLPLFATSRVFARFTGVAWTGNRLLACIPVLNLLSTDFQLVAIAK